MEGDALLGAWVAATLRATTPLLFALLERLERDRPDISLLGTTRVVYENLEGWTDAVAMNVLMGTAVTIQLEELAGISYQPLAEQFRAILPRERRHAELGIEGLRKLLENASEKPAVEASLAYWTPRVAASFGRAGSKRFDALKRFGLRSRTNDALLADWRSKMDGLLAELGLAA